MNLDLLGEAAFDGYWEMIDWTNVEGKRPEWSVQPDEIKDRWKLVAKTVIDELRSLDHDF